jgi:GntR family transcriptional regulator
MKSNLNASRVSRTPGTSLHRQLFMVMRDQILRGAYMPGAMIPREEDLCSSFGVSRITVRRAVADLEAQGLLEKRPPHGTFVSTSLPPLRASATLGLLDSLRKAASETDVEVLNLETIVPPSNIARELEMDSDARAVHVVRLRRKSGTPVMITDAWVPEGIGHKVTKRELKKHALYEILIAQGVAFGRVVQEITAVAATPASARLLDTEIGMPLVQLARLLYDKERRPVQYLTVLFSPERSRILMDVSVNDVNTIAAGTIHHDIGILSADPTQKNGAD